MPHAHTHTHIYTRTHVHTIQKTNIYIRFVPEIYFSLSIIRISVLGEQINTMRISIRFLSDVGISPSLSDTTL